jgi:hypothetical protein
LIPLKDKLKRILRSSKKCLKSKRKEKKLLKRSKKKSQNQRNLQLRVKKEKIKTNLEQAPDQKSDPRNQRKKESLSTSKLLTLNLKKPMVKYSKIQSSKIEMT